MIRTILFDLDGTLLPMDRELFVRSYLDQLAAYLAPHGYDPEHVTETIWNGVGMILQNNGKAKNEAVFWDYFSKVYKEHSLADQPLFEEFYRTAFQNVASTCGYTPEAGKLIKKLKEKGLRIVIATNPVFPAIATESRIRWAGLDPEDFELYTTYENFSFCKPSLDYYRQILNAIGCIGEECIMIGNDVEEDMVVRQLGMKVFLLTDCLINNHGEDISCYPHGGFDALNAYLDKLLCN